MWRLIDCFRNKEPEHAVGRTPNAVSSSHVATYQAPIVSPSPLRTCSRSSCDDDYEGGTLLPKRTTAATAPGAASSSSAGITTPHMHDPSRLRLGYPASSPPMPTWTDAARRGTGAGSSRAAAAGKGAVAAAAAEGTAGLLAQQDGPSAGSDDGGGSDDDDVCPTCLEAYDPQQNPRVWTRCGHHFHMQCIYEWLERKETCPMCESHMDFEQDLLM